MNSDKLIEVAKQLQALGCEIELPYNTRQIMDGKITLEDYTRHKEQHGDASFREKASEDLIKRYYKLILEGDRILVANFDKKDQKNYIGGNALIEMAFAHVNDKPIYILNEIPEIHYKDEILAMNPVVLHGNVEGVAK